MRVLIPTIDYPPIEGGIGTLSRELARATAALGHKVTVIAPHFADMEAFDAAEPVEVIRFPGYDTGVRRITPFLQCAWPHVTKCDLILAPNIGYGGILARLAQARFAVPYLTFAYAYEFLKFRSLLPAALAYRNIYRNAQATIAISNFTAENLRSFGVPQEKIQVVFPGAPTAEDFNVELVTEARTRYAKKDDVLILAVGRFIPRKGHLTLVEALPEILERHPHVQLVMAGRGPIRERCIEKAEALGIESQVHCPGYIDDLEIRKLYAACDLFALPAGEDEGGQVEGFGLVYAEAAAYGKPVIAGNAGGAPDAVLHEETGLLVPPSDPHALAAAISRFLDNPSEAKRFGEAGRERVEKELNWQVFAEKVLEAAE